MRITHIFKTYFPDTQGGLEESIRQIARASVHAGFDVSVVSLSRTPAESSCHGVRSKSFLQTFDIFSNPFSLDLARNIKDVLSSTDIVHLQFPWPTGELLVLLSGVRKPIVVTFHCDIHRNPFFKIFYQPFIHGILDKAHVIVPTSRPLLDTTKILKKYKKKCEVVNLWLDKERFEICDTQKVPIPEYIFKFDNFALFVGVLRWYKGLDILLNAARTVKGQIVIVGKGPLFQKLANRIKQENLGNVCLLGYQDDLILKFLLTRCRFTVLPSTSPAEAFGQILLESSYFSKPMITTELGTATSYVNLNEKTGIVVPPNDANSLSHAMNRLFVSDSDCRQFGQNAFARVNRFFTAEKQAGKYVRIYERLIS